MTYKDKLQEFYNDFESKSQEFRNLHNLVIQTNGFDDVDLIPKYQIAHSEFQMSGNQYHNFLSYIRNQKIDWNSEYMPN